MSTLIYHAGALGDFITAIPAMRLWKKKRGIGETVLLGRPEFGRLAIDSGVIEGCIDAGGLESLPLFSGGFVTEVKKLLSPFSAALLFAAPGSPVIHSVRQCGIPVFWQPPFPSARIHATDYHCSLLADRRLLSADETTPRLAVPPGAFAASEAIVPAGEAFVALHPGSGSKKKKWPFDRFVTVADHLRVKKWSILWIKGPAEESMDLPERDYRAENQALSTLAALLRRCRLYVGNDSGVTHLAAATGCPTIALFGPSDPVVWAPRGERVSIVCKNKQCAPCHPRPHSAGTLCDTTCLAEIGVDEVLEKISEVGRFVP